MKIIVDIWGVEVSSYSGCDGWTSNLCEDSITLDKDKAIAYANSRNGHYCRYSVIKIGTEKIEVNSEETSEPKKELTSKTTVYEYIRNMTPEQMADMCSRICKGMEYCDNCIFDSYCDGSKTPLEWESWLTEKDDV